MIFRFPQNSYKFDQKFKTNIGVETMAAIGSKAREILRIVEAAGKKGITRKKIVKAMRGRACDCENWIRTLLEAGIIEVCGKEGNADLLRVAK